MSKSQTLRALVNERLTAAAEEIFALFERTIAEYEEEVCRSKEENQRKQELLDSMLSPSKSPGPGLDQDPPQTPRIKEEPEEPSVKQQEHTLLIQVSVGAPESSAVCVKTEESSLLQQRQTELREETQGEDISTEPHLHSSDTDNDDDWGAPFSCSAAQMETDADGDHYNRVQKGQRLRALVKEIFALFERTIEEYEEEVCRSKEEKQRKQELLDSMLSPSKSPGPGLDQDPPQTPRIKEEPEEPNVKQEEHTLLVQMASTSGKKRSMVWDHFDLIPPNKVRCLLCTQVLSHSNNTSSMLRHLRARHNTDQSQQSTFCTVSKKKILDETIVDMIIKDGQPFSMVEGEGFTNLMKILDPLYKVPCRKTVKTMVEERYQQSKKKAEEDLKKASALSLTADMWTSRNMDAYLSVTCHYLSDDLELSTVLLGVQYFPVTHTAAHIADAASTMMAEWGVADKVCAIVTDGARNIVASVNRLSIQNIHCFAHLLNHVVKKSISQTSELDTMRSKARKIVGHFKSSCTAKEKLAITQSNMGMPQLKLVQEVETRWNSTFAMFQRMYEQREPLGAALASLTATSNLTSFSAKDYDAINQCLKVLRPFNQATVELSGETRVSGSKVIPITKMLTHVITVECTQMDDGVGATLATHLKNNLKEKMSGLEKVTSLSLATILDPRFKEVAFCSPSNAQAAVERLSRECASLIELSTHGEVQPQPSPAPSDNDNLWSLLDSHVIAQQTSPASDSATEEIQRYLKEQHIPRCEDPLKYWESHKIQYPNLWKLAQKYLCIPASSVPCERIFPKLVTW